MRSINQIGLVLPAQLNTDKADIQSFLCSAQQYQKKWSNEAAHLALGKRYLYYHQGGTTSNKALQILEMLQNTGEYH